MGYRVRGEASRAFLTCVPNPSECRIEDSTHPPVSLYPNPKTEGVNTIGSCHDLERHAAQPASRSLARLDVQSGGLLQRRRVIRACARMRLGGIPGAA
eukprot:6793891-Prymnesium_polylepis.1